ncbi:hypothetical protein EJB05_35944, partial [Eragrostis curvula]
MAIESADGAPSPPPFHAPTSDRKTLEQTHQSTSEATAMSAEQMAANCKAYLAGIRETARERMIAFAECEEMVKKRGQPVPPPLEIDDHPERGDAIGYCHIILSRYKKYLQEYYRLNVPRTELSHQMQANAAVEGSLNSPGGIGIRLDEASRSNKITNCVRKLINMKCCQFPAAAISLKCIMKEAGLMCELVMSGICSTFPMNVSSGIRQCALIFMTYKGDGFYTWSATMMLGRHERGQGDVSEYAMNVGEEFTRTSTSGELIHDEYADTSGLDTELDAQFAIVGSLVAENMWALGSTGGLRQQVQ